MGGEDAEQYYYRLMWSKPLFAKAVLLQGYNLLMMDMDIVVFKPLLPLINTEAHIMTSSDCNWDYDFDPVHPEHKNLMVNAGVLWMRSDAQMLAFMDEWLSTEASTDQNGLYAAMVKKFENKTTSFMHRTWRRHIFPNFCCHYCNAVVNQVVDRKVGPSHDWDHSCPKEIRSQWYAFHVACYTLASTVVNHENSVDGVIAKRDAMVLLWEMQQGLMVENLLVESMS